MSISIGVGSGGGGGDVAKVGTPVDNQLGVWTGDGTLEGSPDLTYALQVLTIEGEVVNINPDAVEITGGLALKSFTETLTFSGDAQKTTVGSFIGKALGVSVRNTTAITGTTATTYDVWFQGSIGAPLATTVSFSDSNETKVFFGSTTISDVAVAATTLDIFPNGGGTLDSGTVEVVVWYWQLT